MAHGDAQEGKWRGNWQIEWVASTLHTTSEHGVSSITTADAHTSAAGSRLNWCSRRFKWTRTFRRKMNLVSAHVPSHFKHSLPHSSGMSVNFYSSTQYHIREETHLCSPYYEIVICHNVKANNPLSCHIKYSEILLKCILIWNCK